MTETALVRATVPRHDRGVVDGRDESAGDGHGDHLRHFSDVARERRVTRDEYLKKRGENWRHRMWVPVCQSQVACDGTTLYPERRERGVCAACEKRLAQKTKPLKPPRGGP